MFDIALEGIHYSVDHYRWETISIYINEEYEARCSLWPWYVGLHLGVI